MKILILGVTGMLGNTLWRVLSHNTTDNTVWSTLRDPQALRYFPEKMRAQCLTQVDVLDQVSLESVFTRVKPDVVVNCIGLIKQLAASNNPLIVLPINAMLPHQLAAICETYGSRLIHISTDCVFSGRKGMYTEDDISDAEDLYGKSKYMGEVNDAPHVVTIRTSMIGHELASHHSLIDWFLFQQGSVKGYTRAIFSGLPCVELAGVIRDILIPRTDLHGLYHVSAEPIDKYHLLEMVANRYKKSITMVPDTEFSIDRSLNSQRFRDATGYQPPDWPTLVKQMHHDYLLRQERKELHNV